MSPAMAFQLTTTLNLAGQHAGTLFQTIFGKYFNMGNPASRFACSSQWRAQHSLEAAPITVLPAVYHQWVVA